MSKPKLSVTQRRALKVWRAWLDLGDGIYIGGPLCKEGMFEGTIFSTADAVQFENQLRAFLIKVGELPKPTRDFDW